MYARTLPRNDYSRAEYQQMLERSEEKLEYHGGKILSMAGAKGPHNRIVMDLTGRLYDNPKSCEPHGSNQALSLPAYDKYIFPDLMFVCEESGNVYEDEAKLFLTNPCLIIEVLSKNTAEYDRTAKFAMYRSLPSFQEYVLVDSRKMQVESFCREDSKGWIIQNLWRAEQELTFHTLGATLSLEEIYRRTTLQPVQNMGELTAWIEEE